MKKIIFLFSIPFFIACDTPLTEKKIDSLEKKETGPDSAQNIDNNIRPKSVKEPDSLKNNNIILEFYQYLPDSVESAENFDRPLEAVNTYSIECKPLKQTSINKWLDKNSWKYKLDTFKFEGQINDKTLL